MLVGLILVATWSLLTPLLALLAARHYIEAKQARFRADLEQLVREWVEPPELGKPSKLGEALDMAGTIVGKAAANAIMANLHGQMGAVGKTASGISDGIEHTANPVLGILAGGKRGKGAAMMRLAELLGPMLAGKGNGGQAGTSGKQAPFTL